MREWKGEERERNATADHSISWLRLQVHQGKDWDWGDVELPHTLCAQRLPFRIAETRKCQARRAVNHETPERIDERMGGDLNCADHGLLRFWPDPVSAFLIFDN